MYNVSRTRTLPPAPDIVIFEEQDRLRFLDALQTARLSIVDPLSYPNVTDLAVCLFARELIFLFNVMTITDRRVVTVDTCDALDNIVSV